MSQRQRLQEWTANALNARLEKLQSDHVASDPTHFLKYEWIGFGWCQMYRGRVPDWFLKGYRPWVARLVGLHPTYKIVPDKALDLVATGDIATMAGVPAATARQWQARGLLPKPVAVTSAGRVWERETIAAWLKGRGYPR